MSVFYSNEEGKNKIFDLCSSAGMQDHLFDVRELDRGKENQRYNRLTDKYSSVFYRGEKIIKGNNFFNRMCFWMATASGKTLVLIKMIEIIDYLKRKGLIPQKEIMVLLPSEKIQNQFADAVDDYNIDKERKIKLTSLKNYEEETNSYNATIFNEITVYIYRSDLLSDQEKAKKVDTVTYDNGGNWYIFMDEAHKGDKEDSLRQDYITIMSRNGFLFNFSATFTDNLDYATTCFNFNLEKFITKGYGKNVYLSLSKYQFKKSKDDLSEQDKQLQVLKSLITLTLVKKSKKSDYYHNALMVTLVNEVNTEDADTDMFFAELAKIARGNIDKTLFDAAKDELYDEFIKNKKFQFGNEILRLDDGQIKSDLEKLTVKDVLETSFNASSFGKIEVIEGEKGKEFALRLQSAEKPFALFRIGDASQYIRKKLAGDYLIVTAYDEKHYFDELNSEDSPFTMLIGSRMFYEGWDSNRPNVMNFINIGTGDAKKFVLQSLGRGVRIEPNTNNRKRLKINDSNKNQLLETLFVFATNRNAVETILDTMDTQKSDERTIELEQSVKTFDLLIPYYKDEDRINNIAKFNISQSSFDKFNKYVSAFSDSLLLLNTKIHKEDIKKLREGLSEKSKLFKITSGFNYIDMPALLDKVVTHLSVNSKSVHGIRELADEIVHFKYIKVTKEKWDELGKDLDDFISASSCGSGENEKELAKMLIEGKITSEELTERLRAIKPKTEKAIGDLKLYKITEHYYLPLILSLHDKLDYIKHIVDVPSEVDFVNNLVDYIKSKNDKFDFEWMFSKIDQTVDSHEIAIPYFNMKDNAYHEFYPDFVFWIKKDKNYKIVFIDPKGTEHSSYLSKVDGFEKLFYKDDKPIIFSYKDYSITFDLKLACIEESNIPKKYKTYWINTNDFTWLNHN